MSIIVYTLFCAWFLTLFNVDTLLVSAVNEVFRTHFSTNYYCFIVFVIIIIEFLKEEESED